MTAKQISTLVATGLTVGIVALAWPGAAGDPVFSHTEHVDMDDSLACDDCHAFAEEGTSLKRDKCEECHDEDIPAHRPSSGPPPLKAAFPHTLHAESLDCSDCHAAAEGDQPPRPRTRAADACHLCHREQGIEVASSACATCHPTVGDLPEGESKLSFTLPHELHADSFDCTECHVSGVLPKAGHGAVVPRPASCFACHEENGVEAMPPNCASCHGTEVTGPAPAADAGIRMPHLPHAKSGKCDRCHSATITADGGHGAAKKISRDECFACHSELGANVPLDKCANCHGSNQRQKKPANHARLWTQQHGLMAQFQGLSSHGESCDMCHRQDGCNACHRREAPRSHNGLWRLRRHGTAAAWDRDSCKTCHETGQCVRCHRDTKPMNHRGAWEAVHGLAAATEGNERCQVCHSPGTCISCHRGNQ